MYYCIYLAFHSYPFLSRDAQFLMQENYPENWVVSLESKRNPVAKMGPASQEPVMQLEISLLALLGTCNASTILLYRDDHEMHLIVDVFVCTTSLSLSRYLHQYTIYLCMWVYPFTIMYIDTFTRKARLHNDAMPRLGKAAFFELRYEAGHRRWHDVGWASYCLLILELEHDANQS